MDLEALAQQPKTKTRDRATVRELTGTIKAIIFQQPYEFVIAKLRSGDIVRGPLDESELEEGTAYRFLGKWTVHVTHGDQFQFDSFLRDTPASKTGIVRYLREAAQNVGDARARQLYDKFGSDAVAVLRENPQAVADAGIMPIDQACEASDTLQRGAAKEKTIVDLFGLFAGRGFSKRTINACIERWGAKAPAVIQKDPFSLLVNDIPGAGFKRCDRMYLDGGGRRNRLKRQAICGWHALHEDSTGHTWFRLGFATEAIEKHCAGTAADPMRALVLAKRTNWITSLREANNPNKVWLAEAGKANKEKALALSILRLGAGESIWPEMEAGSMSAHQLEKVDLALKSPVSILAGTPGTGKTYCAAAIIGQICSQWGSGNVAIAAPTGKAAVRCSQSLRRYNLPIEATTIHRMLGVQDRDGGEWNFGFNREHSLPFRFVFIDESSMLDTSLAASLFEACADGTHVLLIGDPYQLAPVGHGAPLRDMIASGVVPVGELEEIQRNSGMIVSACAEIKQGKAFKALAADDKVTDQANLQVIEAAQPEDIREIIFALYAEAERRSIDTRWDIQVIVATNESSEVSRKPLNESLQRRLNANGKREEPNPFRVGDKIVCLKNGFNHLVKLEDEEAPENAKSWRTETDETGTASEAFVANGEIGEVLAIAPKLTIAKFGGIDRTIKIPMGRQKEDDENGSGTGGAGDKQEGRGCNYDLAYAITAHKSQGSEWPIVVVVLDESAGQVGCREWIYTAISRAAKVCYLVGKRRVADQYCRKVALGARKTFLKERLRREVE